VLLLVFTVMVEEPDLSALNVAVGPVGSAVALNVTVPANPPDGLTLTV
jgi:hypothetical protein